LDGIGKLKLELRTFALMPLTVLSHPLAEALLTELRDKHTPPARYRRLCHRLTTMLAIEATRDLPVKAKEIDTPMEPFNGVELAANVVIVPVLRAGLGMVESVLALLPNAQVGHVGIERDHQTAMPRSYYAKMPDLNGKHILIVDPMLATGGTLLHAIGALRALGGEHISVVSIIAAPEGVAAVAAVEPRVSIVTAALDRCLNEQKYILPGLGDFGDRLMGT
jgi:uracil phosphoribosyltransferase